MKNIIVSLMLLMAGQFACAQNPKIMDLFHYADSMPLAFCRANYIACDGEPTRLVLTISLHQMHDDDAVLVDKKGKVVDWQNTTPYVLELSRRMTQVCEELSKDAVDAYRVEWHRKLQDVYKMINGKTLDGCEANPVLDDVEYAIVLDRDDSLIASGYVSPSIVKNSVRESLRLHHSAKWSTLDEEWRKQLPMPLYSDSLMYLCAIDSVVAERKYIDAKDYLNYVKPILKGVKHRNVSYYCDSILTQEVADEMYSVIRYPENRAPYPSSTEGVIYEFDSKEQYDEMYKHILDATLKYVKLHPDVGYNNLELTKFDVDYMEFELHDVIGTMNYEMRDGKTPKNFNVQFRSVHEFEKKKFADDVILDFDKGTKYYLLIMDTTGDLHLPRQWDKASKCVNGKYTYLKGMGK